MNPHQRQSQWLQLVGSLADNNGQMTMWEHWLILLVIHQANTLNSDNPQMNFILHWGIVTHLRSHHFQALPSFTTRPNPTLPSAHNQVLVQSKDISDMGLLARAFCREA
jgi:hypothetical protein